MYSKFRPIRKDLGTIELWIWRNKTENKIQLSQWNLMKFNRLIRLNFKLKMKIRRKKLCRGHKEIHFLFWNLIKFLVIFELFGSEDGRFKLKLMFSSVSEIRRTSNRNSSQILNWTWNLVERKFVEKVKGYNFYFRSLDKFLIFLDLQLSELWEISENRNSVKSLNLGLKFGWVLLQKFSMELEKLTKEKLERF